MGHSVTNDPHSQKALQALEAERPLFGHNGGPPLAGWHQEPRSIGPADRLFDDTFDEWATTRSAAYAALTASKNTAQADPYYLTPAEEADLVEQINGSPYLQPAPSDDANPKDRMGALKLPTLSVIPSSLLLAVGGVMRLGASKYGRFNWRSKPVKASVYADAAARHLMSWLDGEDVDPESGESHLGHVAACMGILIDAKARGVLVDDRDLHESVVGTAAQIIREKTLQAA